MRLLIGTDGSPAAAEAVRSARRLAPPEETILLHAIEPSAPLFLTGPEVFVSASVDVEKGQKERGEKILAEATSSLAPLPATRVLEYGSPADAILTTAEKERVDLIVVGARGLGAAKEAFLGSVSHRVLHHANCAVLVLRGPLPAVRRVLVPVQSEDDADEIVHFAAKKPFPPPVEFKVIHVLPLTDPMWPLDAFRHDEGVKKAIEQSTGFVGDIADRLVKTGYEAHGGTSLGTPAEAILNEAQMFPADLILMGARHRSRVSRFLLGSVSHTVLHRSEAPVLVLH